MSAVLQDDYGGFSPRFPGVTVRLRDSKAFDTLDRFMRDDRSPADCRDFDTIAIRSVLDHEIRHYHDFLLSPYGSTLYRCKLQAAVACDVLLHLVRGLPGTWLPVPLGRWARLDAEQRSMQTAEWQRGMDAAALDLVPIPLLPADGPAGRRFETLKIAYDEEGAVRLLDAAHLAIEKVRQLTRGSVRLADASELMPCNFFEVLGLAAQLQAIHAGQSADAAALFLGFLRDSALPYARLWRRLMALAKRWPETAGRSLIDDIGVIAMWCILGSYDADGLAACPNVRFLALEKAVASTPAGADVDDAWDRWDAAARVSPWRDNVRAMHSSNVSRLAEYAQYAGSGPLYDAIASTYAFYIRDQAAIVSALLAGPENFAVMARYHCVDIAASSLPLPLTRLDLVGFAMPVGENPAFYPLWGDARSASQFVLHTRAAGFEKRVNDAAALERMMRVTDLALADIEPSLTFDPAVVEDITLMTGKRPIWIM